MSRTFGRDMKSTAEVCNCADFPYAYFFRLFTTSWVPVQVRGGSRGAECRASCPAAWGKRSLLHDFLQWSHWKQYLGGGMRGRSWMAMDSIVQEAFLGWKSQELWAWCLQNSNSEAGENFPRGIYMERFWELTHNTLYSQLWIYNSLLNSFCRFRNQRPPCLEISAKVLGNSISYAQCLLGAVISL